MAEEIESFSKVSPRFAKYSKSGHPALIIGQNSIDYAFMRGDSGTEFSGHHRLHPLMVNPNPNDFASPSFLNKRIQSDKKCFFVNCYGSWHLSDADCAWVENWVNGNQKFRFQ